MRAIRRQARHQIDAPFAGKIRGAGTHRAFIPGAIHLACGLSCRIGLDLFIPDRGRDDAGVFHLLDLFKGRDTGGLVDGDALAIGRKVTASLFIGDHAEPFAVAVEIGLRHHRAGIGSHDLFARSDEIIPAFDGGGIYTRLFIEVAAIEHRHRTRVPRNRIGDAVNL
ncbi:hypothetical protein D3C78_1045950 [compost metagenome]